ncbi:MAG: OmpA family protein [bacterium]
MRINEAPSFRLHRLICGLALLLAATPLVYGQVTTSQTNQTTAVERNIQSIPNGAKLKFKGVVIAREGEIFRIRDRNRTDYQVLITDRTSIKANGGFLRSGKKYPVTEILRGLIVEVEGRGDSQGQLVADKIRFAESDMRAAITSDTRVTPVEENQQRIAGQMDELYAVAAEARNEATAANERITALDEYDVHENIAVNFRVNSAVLSPEAKQQLDEFAAKTTNAKAYSIEVSGHTDSTGSEAKNFRLSRARADAVVQYLAVNHKIPLRRFSTPMGYGKTDAVADNTTGAGRAQNRRVEVKMLLNRGMSRNTAPTTTKP